MDVVAVGVIVRKEPSGFTVIGWHRHDRLVEDGCEDDFYDRLDEQEMLEVVGMHLLHYRAGDPCEDHSPWIQTRFW